jgi:hypothetical protein
MSRHQRKNLWWRDRGHNIAACLPKITLFRPNIYSSWRGVTGKEVRKVHYLQLYHSTTDVPISINKIVRVNYNHSSWKRVQWILCLDLCLWWCRWIGSPLAKGRRIALHQHTWWWEESCYDPLYCLFVAIFPFKHFKLQTWWCPRQWLEPWRSNQRTRSREK